MAQSLKSSFASMLSDLSLDDLAVDSEGRVRIANPDLAKRIADLKGTGLGDPFADSVNTGTCNNTACFAPDMAQLAKRGNPAGR